MRCFPLLTGCAHWPSKFVPKDRPIDGVDASAFMFDTSHTSGRDNYMFFAQTAN
jgi:hypothetical protein